MEFNVKNDMNEGLGAVEVVADAVGEFAVFFVGGIRREVHILGDVLTQVNDGTPVRPLVRVHNDHQGIVKGMSIGVIGRHRQGVAVNVHRLVVAARNAEFVKMLVKIDAVVLGGTVADGIDRGCRGAIFVMARHAGIGVLMPLQHKVNAILMHQIVE